MKEVRNAIICIAAVFTIAAGMFYLMSLRDRVVVETVIDTVVVRDTVRDTVLIPEKVWLVRVDTVLLYVPADTVYREVALPIESREYRTDDYYAVVEGWRPRLVQMEVYPETKYVTENRVRTITRRPRVGLGIQAGYGLSLSNRTCGANSCNPARHGAYVGVGLQYNLLTF